MTRNKVSLIAVLAPLLAGLAFALWFLPLDSARANPGVLYAAPTAQGSGNCSSWANACTLQTALTNAVSGDEIWVKAGAHYPGAAGNRSATFTLKNGVALYGGFAGTETLRTQRNWQTNKTILSGDIDRNDTNTDSNYIAETWNDIQGNNAYNVVTGSSVDSTAALNGFIVTAGDSLDKGSLRGGGMYSVSGSPTLANCIFSGNRANLGGAMFNQTSSPALANVVFSGNYAREAGGMYNTSSNPTLANVSFSGNKGEYRSGGISTYGTGVPALVNSILWGNSNYGNTLPEIYGPANVTYSIVRGGWTGEGNLDTAPLFVDPANGNLRLGPGSPAIESGANTGCPATDLDGLPRPADGNGDGSVACDMGAYEAGQMMCGIQANTSYTFDRNSNVQIDTTAALGNLACLYVDEMGINHPNATTGIQTGRYWLIRGLQSDKQTDATGFTVTLTLLHANLSDPKICRYPGRLGGYNWDCDRTSFDAATVWRASVTAFSDWAVGNHVGPTAVRLTSLVARPAATALPVGLGAALLALAGWATRRKQRLRA